MKMEKITVRNASSFEYEICAYLMRKRILKAYIHLPNENIMDRLSEYLFLCHIPSRYLEDAIPGSRGYILCASDGIYGEELIPHIYISFGKDKKILEGEQGIQLVLDGDMAIEEQDDIIDLDTVPIHLQNSQIRKMFLYAFKVADTEIDIISPWMNAGVIDEDFLSLMDAAMSRGVKIKILYGLKPDSHGYNLSRSRRSDQMAELMRTRFANRGDMFWVRKDNIHYKLVLCDEKYKLEGGFNYLSFTGNYDDADTRREGSPFGRNVEEIRFLRKRYFGDQ